MKIAIASDHAGFPFKKKLYEDLQLRGHFLTDYGTYDKESCDYPVFAIPALRSVVEGRNQRGILICGTGIGMSILANKFPGIRAALVYSSRAVRFSREHNDSNVLCLGGREHRETDLLKWVHIWLKTPYEAGHHQIRLSYILDLDQKRSKSLL